MGGKEREEEEDKGNVYGVKRGIEGRVVIERWDTLEIGEEMDGWMGERARGARLGLASLGEVRRSLIGWVVGIA